jgi:hypothetical protein
LQAEDVKSDASKVVRVVHSLNPTEWKAVGVTLVVLVLVALFLFGAARAVFQGNASERRDSQHNANVSADLGAADKAAGDAANAEADRREAEGRYQEQERAVTRARSRAVDARIKDEEATRRYVEASRRSTSDEPAITDDDVCTELKSVNVRPVGCREK